jgi:hypothetical protein
MLDGRFARYWMLDDSKTTYLLPIEDAVSFIQH